MERIKFLELKQSMRENSRGPNDFKSKNGKTFTFKWIDQVSTEELLAIRNSSNVIKNMRNENSITFKEHEAFLEAYGTLERIDFLCIEQPTNNLAGGICITKTPLGYELGKYIGNADYLGKGIAYPMTKSFLNFVDENITEIESIKAATKITNYININLNFKLGFKIEKCVDNEYWLMKR